MEEVSGLSPNRPPKTPMGNDRRDNPGQTKIFEDSEGNSQVPSAPSWSEETPLNDIVAQYTDVGTSFNNLALNAAGNVGDRQVKLVDNDFGGTNPYMYNTYYEPSASAFASEMRMEGTQAALDEGLARAEKEAENNLAAAKKNYSDYLASQNNENERKKAENIHVSETDMAKMPEGTTEAELQKFINATEGMTDEERRNAWIDYQIHNIQNKSSEIDWNYQGGANSDWTRQQYSTDFRRKYYSDEQWNAMSKEEQQAFYDRPDIGNAWTEGYMKKYFYSVYGQEMGDKMSQTFDKLKDTTEVVIDAVKRADFSSLKNEDVYIPGVDISSDLSPKVEAMKKAIEDSDKLSDDQKKNAIAMISGEKWIGTGGTQNNYEQFGVERCLEELESKNAVRSMEKDGSFYKAVWKDKDGNKYDDNATGRLETVYQVLSLFSEGSSEYGLTYDASDVRHPDHIGVLTYKPYLDMGELSRFNYGLHEGETIYQNANESALSAALSGAYGFDLKSAKDLVALKSNDPDTFNYLNDHTAFIMSGGAGAFEVVTDKDKKYYLNGKYWSASDENSPISVGDLVFHSIDGTINADGEYTDSDLKAFVDGYKEIWNGNKDASDENIKALETSYNQYQNRLIRSFFLAQNKGTSVDENMYAVMLALDGKAASDLQFVNPANPKEKISVSALSDWFNSMDDDGKYMTYTALVNNASKSSGFLTFYDEATGQYYQKGIKTNGIDTVGRYNENINNTDDKEMTGARQVENLTPTQALAILFYLDNQIEEGTIDKGFFDNDENNFATATTNSIIKNAKGMADAVSGVVLMGLGGLTSLFGDVDEDGTNQLMRDGYGFWNDMNTLSPEDDLAPGNNDTWGNSYTQSVRDRQRASLNHMVDTTFNLHYFDAENEVNEYGQLVNKNGEVMTLDNNHFNHEDRVKALSVQTGDMAGAMIEFVLEIYAGAAIGKALSLLGKGAKSIASAAAGVASKTSAGAKVVNATKHVVDGVARFLTSPVTFRAISSASRAAQAERFLGDVAFNYGDDIAEGIVDGTINSLDDIARVAAASADNATVKTAEAVAETAAKEVAKETTEKVVSSGVKEAVTGAAKSSADNVAAGAVEAGAKTGATEAANVAVGVIGRENGTRFVWIRNSAGRLVKLTEDNAKAIISAGKTATKAIKADYAIRYGLDAVISNTDNAGSSLAKRMTDKVLKVLETKHPFFKETNSAFRSLVEDSFEKGAVRAAMNARIASVSGVDAAKIASMSDDVASALYGVVDALGQTKGDIESVALKTLSRNQKKLARDVILENIDFSKAVEKIAELSESAARSGTKLALDDVYKIMATSAGTKPGELLKSLRISEFAKDRVKDWSRDIAQNYWNPELDENFESQYVDWEEYISNPENILLSVGFDAGATMLGKGINRIRLHATEKAIDDIIGNGVDMSTANKVDAAKLRKDLMKLDRLRVQSEKLNNKILDNKVSFEDVHALSTKSEKAIKEHVKNILGDVDFETQCERINAINADAQQRAQDALAKGTIRGKRQYRRILADTQQLNRLIIRGNDKLKIFVEANNALQQNSITRYLDIESKAKIIHKISSDKWAIALKKTYDTLNKMDFAKTFGGIDESPKSYTGFTINSKSKKNTKEILSKGQHLLYDTLYENVIEVMGDYLTTTEKKQLKAELNFICENMIAGGNRVIDQNKKVRWNYFPTQALTWQSEPGTSSAVRALWGWDYKAGVHTSLAGEIADPTISRDDWDIINILNDHEGGIQTFKRAKGDKAIEVETRQTGKPAVPTEDVPYNWAGFDPAYACNAYLNTLDSAEFITPILDPINGVIVVNPDAANAIVSMTNRIANARIAELSAKYKKKAAEKVANAGKGKTISKERKEKLLSDLSKENVLKVSNASKIGSIDEKINTKDTEVAKKVENSRLIKNLAAIYAKNTIHPGDTSYNRFAIKKHQQAFMELGRDIQSVRAMYNKDGSIKKKYLGDDGKIKDVFLDAQGNLSPDGPTSMTYKYIGATQYREMVNKLAKNDSLKLDDFDENNSRVIRFDDGSKLNALSLNETLYGVLVTKQMLDIGMDTTPRKPIKEAVTDAVEEAVDKAEKKTDKAEIQKNIIGKRLQPILLDDDNARYALTSGARDWFNEIYGKYNKFSKSYEIDGKLDEIIQTAINKAYDQIEAEGGQINVYDFIKLVDANLPDFVKNGDKVSIAAAKNLSEVLEHLRTYETSGGNISTLYDDLQTAYANETDPVKKKMLRDAIDIVKDLDDYNTRTTGRGALSESDVESPNKGGEDFDDRYDDDLSDQGGVNGIVGQNTGEIDIDEEDRKLFPGTAETVDSKNENTPTSVGTENATAQKTSLSSGSDSGTYEVSTAGDKRFSALNAKFDEKRPVIIGGIDMAGLTIEEAYQKLKGAGKGKAPTPDSQIGIHTSNVEHWLGRPLTKAEKEAISLESYTDLWREWARQNPELIEELRAKSSGKKLTDKFAKTKVSQAAALTTILEETDPLRPIEFKTSKFGGDIVEPEGIRKKLKERGLDFDSLDSSTRKAFDEYEKLVTAKKEKAINSKEFGELQDLEIERNEKIEQSRYGAELGIPSDEYRESREFDYDDSYTEDFLYRKVYGSDDVVKKRKELFRFINEDLYDLRVRRQKTPEIAVEKIKSLKDSLDYLHGKANSDYRQRTDYRAMRRKAYNDVSKQFNNIADAMEKKVAGGKSDKVVIKDILKYKDVDFFPSPEEIYESLHRNKAVLSQSTIDKIEAYRKVYRRYKKNGSSSKDRNTVLSILRGSSETGKSKKGLFTIINEDAAKHAQSNRVKQGTGIYRGSDFLSGANDSQYLAFINGNHERTWNKSAGAYTEFYPDGTRKNFYNNTADKLEARNAIKAGRDGFGNIIFMDPDNLIKYAEKNGLDLDAKDKKGNSLRSVIEEYRTLYNTHKDTILDKDKRYNISDENTGSREALVSMLANVYNNESSSYSKIAPKSKNASVNKYHTEKEFYGKNKEGEYIYKRGANEVEKAEREASKVGSTIHDSYQDLYPEYEPEPSYDFTGYDRKANELSSDVAENTVGKQAESNEESAAIYKYLRPVRDAYAERDAFVDETLERIHELDDVIVKNTTQEMRDVQNRIDAFKEEYKKNGYQKYNKPLEKTEEYIALENELEAAKPEAYKKAEAEVNKLWHDISKKNEEVTEVVKSHGKYGPSTEQQKKAAEAASRLVELDEEYSKEATDRFDKDSTIPDYAEEESERMVKYSNTPSYKNTAYEDFMDASKDVNTTKETIGLNKMLYGDGDKTGYFDEREKLVSDKKKLSDSSEEDFVETFVDRVSELKGIDDATDSELLAILVKAKNEANNIKDKDVREHVLKRIDDEIDFVKTSTDAENADELAKKMLERDPEYQAYKANKEQYKAENNDTSKLSVQVPSTANPVFVRGEFTPDGQLSLQQILDAQNVVELHGKKNNMKSTRQTKQILKSMRGDSKTGYDGSSKISGGAAKQQKSWIINLYCRVHDASGLDKLPRKPSFEEIEKGFMKAEITTKDGKKKMVTIKLPIKLSEIYVDPKIASLGSRYWGEGKNATARFIAKRADTLSKFTKGIQDMQLAGGYGQYNAFTLRNALTLMLQDPIGGTRALFTNFANARSNDSVINFYLQNHEKLLKMAMDSGDYSAINGFVNVINMRDEVTGGGMISEFGHQIAEIPNVFKEKGLIAGFGENLGNLYEAIFNNPTFVRWTIVAQADLNLRNYDKAKRYVNRICAMYGITDDDFANIEGGMATKDKYIATLAQMRSDRYWKPSEFAKSFNNTERYLNRKQQFVNKKTLETLRGMPQKKTLRQCLSDFFFAIGYKLQMNMHPVDGIATLFTALPNNARAFRGLKNKASFNVASSRFVGRGNRNEVMAMIGICALAHAWNTYIGAPSAWEELWSDHGNKDRKTYGLAKTLENFQDLGKFWIPVGDNKYVGLDPFFSIFTLQNSAMKAVDKAVSPQTASFNPQRTGFQEPGSFGARVQGVMDELVGANLLSPYKAIYEVLNNSTYYGNNIWERSRLPDGTENPNYNPLRNLMASVAHIMNLEELWLGDTTNRWVKGLDIDAKTWENGEPIDPKSIGPSVGDKGKLTFDVRTGTVAGSGILQHEFITAAKKAAQGDYFGALTEAMELPFKSRDFEARARTDLNTEVMLSLRFAKQKYDKACEGASIEDKNKAYKEFADTAVKIIGDWSARHEYALGKNHDLDATATKILVAFLADEYDDASNKIMYRYDKLRQELKMAEGEEFLFSKEAMEAAIADGMDDVVAAEKHNAHLKALREAQIKEYNARQALIEAGFDPGNFETPQYIRDDLSAKSATFDKKTYEELKNKFEQPVGEFKNFKEMKSYYETLIENASTTKQKAKLANEYNKYVTDIIAPYVGNGFAAQAFNNIYWDGENLANSLGQYIIIPADKYYKGKTPNANYLKDQLGIGWRDNHNLPSDADVTEQINKANKALSRGNVASAASLIDNILVQLRKGTMHASPEDYEKLIRMRALLSSRSN